MKLEDKRIIWVDVETTGLDPQSDNLLSVGCIITDGRLEEIARAEWDLNFDEIDRRQGGIDRVVDEMHTKSGLWDRCAASDFYCEDVESLLHGFIQDHAGPGKHTLAGNSVWFDRAFLEWNVPRVLECFSHRLLDVSALKVIASIWHPGAPAPDKSKANHTPLADLEASIAELRHWDKHLLGGTILLATLGGES